jgi:carboxyl-terminal processing protease
VLQVKQQDGGIKTHDDVDPGVAYAGPLVVLTNRLSASASEIFAGAIRDYERGIVVGDETTHGKGTVQNVMPVPPRLFRFLADDDEKGALKLTIQQFYRVNGDSTQNKGVPSDIVLPSMLDHLDLGEQFLDNALAFDRIEPAEGTERLGLVQSEIIKTLKGRSQERVRQDDEFSKLQKRIARVLERKEQKEVSLNETIRKAELDADKESVEEEIAEEATPGDGDEPVFPESYYNDEVLRIASDYAALLQEAITAKR